MIPHLTGVALSGPPDPRRPLLVVGPALGTTAATLWSACARELTDYDVLGWDLPGHGVSAPATEQFSVDDLAAAVIDLVDRALADRGQTGAPVCYAGNSIGGAVGLHLLLDHPERISAAALSCTGPRIGTPSGWLERAETVRRSGTSVLITASAQRWFAPSFLTREPDRASALLHALADTDATSYGLACEALADFDITDRLPGISRPVLAVAGAHDVATPVTDLTAIAAGVGHGRLELLTTVGHQAPIEDPAGLAALIAGHCRPAGDEAPSGPGLDPRATVHHIRRAGIAARREVLGDAHVDRALAATTDLTRDFQDLITQYAWGTIWTRPGLDRRTRSVITLTALIARGHHEELEMHLRAAGRNGLTDAEITEVILQTAVYCGVPDANTAFRIAQTVLGDPSRD